MGLDLGGGGFAPDAHTPTITNYHCVMVKKEEVKTEASLDPDESVCPFLSTETRGEKHERGQYR